MSEVLPPPPLLPVLLAAAASSQEKTLRQSLCPAANEATSISRRRRALVCSVSAHKVEPPGQDGALFLLVFLEVPACSGLRSNEAEQQKLRVCRPRTKVAVRRRWMIYLLCFIF